MAQQSTSPAATQSVDKVSAATRGLSLYMEQGIKTYRDQFRGAYGPYPAVQLFRTLDKLCSEYADRAPKSMGGCRDYATRVYKQLKDSLQISESWWKVLHHDEGPALHGNAQDTVVQVMTMSAIALHLAADILFLKDLENWDTLGKQRMAQFKNHYEDLINEGLALQG